MVAFSHSVWRQAEQIHLLLPAPSCLFRPERGQAQVFERMTGPDLWKEKPGGQPLECSALTTSLTQCSVSLLGGGGGGRAEQPPQNPLTLGRLHPRWQGP